MTEPLLNYQSASPNSRSPLRTFSWITLLGFGCLLSLVGTCLGMITWTVMMSPGAGSGRLEPWLDNIEWALILAATLGSGIAYVVASFGVRNRSRSFTKFACIMTPAHIAFLITIVSLDAAQSPPPRKPAPRPDMTLVNICTFLSLIDAALAICFFRLLRSHPREDPS